MKIKVAILDEDENYKNRLLSNFQVKYADKLELYVFSSISQLISFLENNQLDLILLDDDMKSEQSVLSAGTLLVYLCKTKDIAEINGIPAICKFQKIETIYKQILGIYAENLPDIKLKTSGTSASVVLFVSAQGGSGTSTAAAAYALKCAMERKKVFYLNLEQFGGADEYFSADGSISFSDVIYALKTRKNNLLIKLESATKTDKSGVDYFDNCKNAYDMLELKNEEIGPLLRGIAQMKEYEEIIVDISGGMDQRMLMLMQEYAARIICVSDGSQTGNKKFECFCEVLGIEGKRSGKDVLNKMDLLYNRFGTRTSSQLKETAVRVLGGIHRYEGISGRVLIEQIAQNESFKQI